MSSGLRWIDADGLGFTTEDTEDTEKDFGFFLEAFSALSVLSVSSVVSTLLGCVPSRTSALIIDCGISMCVTLSPNS